MQSLPPACPILCPALAEPLESDNQQEGDAQEEDNNLQHADCPQNYAAFSVGARSHTRIVLAVTCASRESC